VAALDEHFKQSAALEKQIRASLAEVARAAGLNGVSVEAKNNGAAAPAAKAAAGARR
jgi:hypothetical protein